MKTYVFALVYFILFAGKLTWAQDMNRLPWESMSCHEKCAFERSVMVNSQIVQSSLNHHADMNYAVFKWWVDPAVQFIRGEVLYTFVPSEDLQTLEFDFAESLTMDSVVWNGRKIEFMHLASIIRISFPELLKKSVMDSVSFYYHGVPSTQGFGSFVTESRSNGDPLLWTLSEPFGSKEWMPCKQDLKDKLDSIDVYVIHPEQFKAASNGILVSEVVENGIKTSHWQHRYPIAYYLIGIAVTRFEVFQEKFGWGKDSVLMVNYAFEESLDRAKAILKDLGKQMQLFNELFGLYPFHKEKYGHAEFGWGGGMEHQTMSFMGDFGYELAAHELAHQWFGNKVSCASWKDIWLNEGFATYLSGLCYEHLLPMYWYRFKEVRIQDITSEAGGTLMVDDTTQIGRIFSGRLSYSKGAMVLHMLRWICGDSIFFKGVRNYLEDANIAYGTSTTKDLERHLEAASGKDLSEFFLNWYTREGYPSYRLQWSQTNPQKLELTVNQSTSHPSVEFFKLPLPVRLLGTNGQSKDVILDHQWNGQNFIIQVDFSVDSIVFDPDIWLISAHNSVHRVPVSNENPRLAEIQVNIYPNPVMDGWGRFSCYVNVAGKVTATLVDVQGKTTQWIEQLASPGWNNFSAKLDFLPAGLYVLRIRNEEMEVTKRMFIMQ